MKKAIWVLTLLCCSFISCSQNQSNDEQNPKIDSNYANRLKIVYKEIQNIDNIRSVLVSHNNALVGEGYFRPFPKDSLEHVRSVTKSIMATLIGIAIDQGIIKSIDDPITEYLNDKAKGKESITIKHLLSMTSGIKWNEVIGNMEIDDWINSESPLNYVLEKQITYEPGTQWEYSTGIIHLLSVILTNASGMNTVEFAKKYLFSPLNINNVRWQKLNDGYYHGGSRLEIKPKDMIKIGELYLNKGIYNKQRIISESFIKEATSPQQPKDFFNESSGYGYAWWIGKGEGISGYMAQGYGGQTIFVVPNHQLVIAITYKWKVGNQKALDQQKEATNTIVVAVLKGLSIL